ncbi:MAG: low specificity L-threonine aldolase [Gammaproteobacteria bacterium]
MIKHAFLDDYSEGCHPAILDALANTNLAQQPAYGDDPYSVEARALIQAQVGLHDVPIYFVSGGTLANLIIIASALRPHEAVISAHSGHIALWETGAIEATGHKIISCPSDDGKLTPALVNEALAQHSQYPHVAKPRLVYISNATEVGTIYSKHELTALAATCRQNELLLMLDGARLGPAVCAPDSDLTLSDVAKLCDVFWIGGTKAGALIGEAIVIPNAQLAVDFRFHIKQRGALLAKGRLLGLQFKTLFSDDLFFAVNRHANAMAQKLSRGFIDRGFALFAPTQSNQVFPILEQDAIDQLRSSFSFHDWEPVDAGRMAVRFVTSWATQDEHIDALLHALDALQR